MSIFRWENCAYRHYIMVNIRQQMYGLFFYHVESMYNPVGVDSGKSNKVLACIKNS